MQLVFSEFPVLRRKRPPAVSLAMVVGEAHAWGLPVMGEMVPGGFDSPDHMRTAESVQSRARVGAELGADWV